MQNILHSVLFIEYISPCDGLFLQFIVSEKSVSGEYISQLFRSRGESYTTDKNRSGEEEEYSGFSWKKLAVT